MHLRYDGVLIGITLFLFIVSIAGNTSWAQQASNGQPPALTSVSGSDGSSAKSAMDKRRDFLVSHLYLNMYEAEEGNLSACSDNDGCLKRLKIFNYIGCASDVCTGKIKSKKLLDCLQRKEDFNPSDSQIDQINMWGCALIKHPGIQTAQEMAIHIPKAAERRLVEFGAYILAYKGSAESCEDYIKSYVGPYGPTWNYKWYRVMSGCRILAHERTREQEEKDFYTWFGVAMGKGSCSDIVNPEMRDACSAPGAATPIHQYAQ